MNSYILLVIFMLLTAVIITRFLPFVFTRQLEKHEKIKVLGDKLPSYIMMLLLIYQLHPANLVSLKAWLVPLMSLILVIIIHKSFRKPLLSIASGVICFYLIKYI